MKTREFVMDGDLGDRTAPPGSRPWLLYVANEIRKTLYDKEQTGSRLRSLVQAFKEHQGWQELGYLTWEDFCEAKLHKDASLVETEVTRRAHEATPERIRKEGRPPNDNSYNSNSFESQGNSADYLTARIARDRPDILEDMKAGKYSSVRRAAIDAGIVKDRKRFSFYADDPGAAGAYLAERVSQEWMLEMMDAFYKGMLAE